jgi:hypothetical protein
MKTCARCAPCILDDLVGATERLGLRESVRAQVTDEAVAYLAATYRAGAGARLPSEHITEVHRILKRVAGLPMPFEELRRRCNEIGVAIAQTVAREAALLAPVERFHLLVRWSIAGNHLDFRTVGVGYDFAPERIAAVLRTPMDEGLAVDQVGAIREAALRAKEVLFIHDNVGELAFDRLLCAELRASGARVVSALRGGPITSDAVVEDGAAVGLEDSVDEIIVAGPDTLGISLPEASVELRAALGRADLVVSKGQANYYVFSERPPEVPVPVALLLRTKCLPVSQQLGFQRVVNAALLLAPPQGAGSP